MSPIGHRINPSAPPVPAAILDDFRDAAVAVISDNMNRLHGSKSLRPYHRSGRLIGTAVTVKTRPGDNQTLHKAYEILRAGDVLVVDGSGDLAQALVGEIMMSRAKAIGVAGFVIDGAIRDVDAFVKADFPCYARGVTHRGPYKSGPGEINVPVSVDGMVVMPGDVVIGDADGVVTFDRAEAAELLALVRKQEAREADALKAIAEGRLDNAYIGVAKAP
ncbi:RraA family protein [Bradyrhizobium frederickii]|uniref:Putative 4-hydroxy-4-methyl-2-oxoglutarate aldolase n=1 Tax=Bradyrhizobium frederickii TaxID=2560054 RepID=A0A4Y9LJ86_9BRAD|nr:RraA family protein [Bradyrhizobium frederickii]TFV42717.1 RraA family protein [Bradyrhizobium frederickii]TFV79749.1 RraA family protein [Bradyrhizobium frederickii]